MSEQTPRKEGYFGQIVIARRFATATDVAACVEVQDAETAAGTPRRPLGQIMVERGYITQAQLTLILEEQRRRSGPKKFGPYEILNKIGEGGMSAVYKARVQKTGAEVALKMLPRRYAEDAAFLSRFQREARMGVDLDHPNIVATYDFGEIGGIHYIALEYVDGGSLDQLLRARNILTEYEALTIIREVAQALDYAVSRGLVHRDIKPSNIMLGSEGAVKLSDFGLVKQTDPEASNLTQSGLMVGTPHYISPEQARSDRDLDIRADIYSLGATLYHLVTGKTPFEGSSPLVVISKHLSEELTPPDEINPGLSEGCVTLIEKMMAKDRADRYATPQQLIADIERVLNGEEPAEGGLDIGKSSVRISSKRYERVQRAVAQRSPLRPQGAAAAPSHGNIVVQRRTAEVPIRDRAADQREVATRPHRPVASGRKGTADRHSPVREKAQKPARKLSPVAIVATVVGGAIFLIGLVLALRSDGKSPPPDEKPPFRSAPAQKR